MPVDEDEDPDQLLSLEKVAELTGLPLATLYKYRTTGNGPVAYKIGRHLRFRRSEVRAWVDEHRSAASG